LAYPGKAVLFSNRIGAEHPWAVFMAGGSLAAKPKVEDPEFYRSASSMNPVKSGSNKVFILSNPEGNKIIYSLSAKNILVDLKKSKKNYTPVWINPKNGTILKQEKKIEGGKVFRLNPPFEDEIILWIK
jgi:hypothetical protein